MKEIDFLPDWYTTGRKRKVSYQTQYAAILAIIGVMAGWSFYTARSVSNAQAKVEVKTEYQQKQDQAAQEYSRVQEIISQFETKSHLLSSLDCHMRPAAVVAELSYLVSSEIIITNASISAEAFDKSADENSSSGPVRVVKSGQAQLSQGDVRFRVTVRGLATEAGDVAKLICKLEDSQYFDQVVPGFSRTKKLKDREVTEFEIGCFVSNYKQEKI